MQFLQKFLERVITSLVISAAIFFFSFSYMTGRFPPSKADMQKAFNIAKNLVMTNKDYANRARQLQAAQGSGQQLNLEQMLEFQRLTLKRTEMTVELLDIFKRIQLGPADQELQEKLHRVSLNLGTVEKDLADIADHYQKLQGTPATESVSKQ